MNTITQNLADALRLAIEASDTVVANWESGDLAGAINVMEGDAEKWRALLAAYDAERVNALAVGMAAASAAADPIFGAYGLSTPPPAHTPEPWHHEHPMTRDMLDAEDWKEYIAGNPPITRIAGQNGETVANAHDLFEFTPANAARIVACVNFMAGTPTHHIEALLAARETFNDYNGSQR
jgi:hypothetical protein